MRRMLNSRAFAVALRRARSRGSQVPAGNLASPATIAAENKKTPEPLRPQGWRCFDRSPRHLRPTNSLVRNNSDRNDPDFDDIEYALPNRRNRRDRQGPAVVLKGRTAHDTAFLLSKTPQYGGRFALSNRRGFAAISRLITIRLRGSGQKEDGNRAPTRPDRHVICITTRQSTF